MENFDLRKCDKKKTKGVAFMNEWTNGVKCLHFIYSSLYLLIDVEKRNQPDLFMIIYCIAQGLQYFHEDLPKRIIHRDLKSQNILLDSEFEPKIFDFRLGKIFVRNQSQDMTQAQARTR